MICETHRPKRLFVLALALLATLFGLSLLTGCAFFGIADPAVRSASYDVVDALTTIHNNSDDPVTVGLHSALALERMSQYDKLEDKLTDLDKQKVKQLREGLQSIFDRRTDANYVLLRSFTLRELAASIGLYGHEGLKKTKELIEEVKKIVKPEDKETDNGSARSETGPGTSEGEAEGSGNDTEDGEGSGSSE